MRHVGSAPCEGDWVVTTLDEADGDTGLLILSGGNEIAIGPQRAMARLSELIAARGWPVLRFDRRGVGDSGGKNNGWRSSAPDVAAALTFFSSYTKVQRVVAFGNCDAATAIVVNRLPIASRVLGNPWLDLAKADLPPKAAIRAHYRKRIVDPSLWRSLLTGGVDLTKAFRGVWTALDTSSTPSDLTKEFAAALFEHNLHTRIVLSAKDATGVAFAHAWQHELFDTMRAKIPVQTIDTDSHGFTGPLDLFALCDILVHEIEAVSATIR